MLYLTYAIPSQQDSLVLADIGLLGPTHKQPGRQLVCLVEWPHRTFVFAISVPVLSSSCSLKLYFELVTVTFTFCSYFLSCYDSKNSSFKRLNLVGLLFQDFKICNLLIIK